MTTTKTALKSDGKPPVSARRAEMVQAAARLFSERGYHGTSIQHLANALGLQKGSLYAHIGSKEDLLLDVVEEGANRFLERAEQTLMKGGTASERITRLLVSHIETAAQHLDAATVFLNEWRYLSPELRETVQSQRDRYEQMFRSVVEEGIVSGEFRDDVDPRFAGLLLLSAGNWTYTWYRPGGDMTPKEIGRRFATLIVKGLEA